MEITKENSKKDPETELLVKKSSKEMVAIAMKTGVCVKKVLKEHF